VSVTPGRGAEVLSLGVRVMVVDGKLVKKMPVKSFHSKVGSQFCFLIIIKSVPIYRDPEGDRLLIEGAFTMFLLAGLK